MENAMLRWTYVAPCLSGTDAPTVAEIMMDLIHCEIDGAPFSETDGLNLNGRIVWPGLDPGCRCIGVAFDDNFKVVRQ